MPEINQYVLSRTELLELLIKQNGVHEGRWMLMAVFGFSAGYFGPSPDQSVPGAVVALNQIGIQRAQVDTPKEMSLDAAVVNPDPKPKPMKRRV
jgi:hypothetical protein